MLRISQVHFTENAVAVVYLFSIGCKVSVKMSNSPKSEYFKTKPEAIRWQSNCYLFFRDWFYFFPQQLQYQNLRLFILRVCRSTTSLQGEGKAER